LSNKIEKNHLNNAEKGSFLFRKSHKKLSFNACTAGPELQEKFSVTSIGTGKLFLRVLSASASLTVR